jgi:hypothetical protein
MRRLADEVVISFMANQRLVRTCSESTGSSGSMGFKWRG